MMRRLLIGRGRAGTTAGRLLAAAALAGLAAPAAAGPVPDGGVTVQEVVTVLQDKGYRADVGKPDDGSPFIRTAVEGTDMTVMLFSCEKGRCGGVEFVSDFPANGKLTTVEMNRWNRTKHFGKAYTDENGKPTLEADLDVEKGYTTEAVANDLARWSLTVASFKDFLRCTTETTGKDCLA